MAAGDIEHDLDEMGQGQLAGILSLGDLVEEFVEGVPSMIQSNAMRVMTAAGAPSTKGLRMAGRTNGASLVGESNPRRPN